MNLQHLKQLLQQSHDLVKLQQCLVKFFESFAITSVAFTHYEYSAQAKFIPCYDWATSPLKPWHDYYLAQGFNEVDSTLNYSASVNLPLLWDVTQQLAEAKQGREQQIREESLSFGIDKGLSIPLYGPQMDFAVLVLHQRQHEKGLHHYHEHEALWMTAGQYYFHHERQHLMAKGQLGLKHPQLTQRERQCLSLTAENLSVAAIAKRLNITPRTVNFHLQNANKKLGSKNKYLTLQKVLRRH